MIGLHHAQVCVPTGAEDEARRFYCGLLGLEEIAKPEALRARGGFWLQVGSAQVHVGTERLERAARERTKAHVAYEVANLEAWKRLVREAGFDVTDGEPLPGGRPDERLVRCELRDPFGNRVELLERVSSRRA